MVVGLVVGSEGEMERSGARVCSCYLDEGTSSLVMCILFYEAVNVVLMVCVRVPCCIQCKHDAKSPVS